MDVQHVRILIYLYSPVEYTSYYSEAAMPSLFRMLEYLANQDLTSFQQSKRSSQETPPIYYSWQCKPFNFRHSTETFIQRMKHQAFSTWPDNAELISS